MHFYSDGATVASEQLENGAILGDTSLDFMKTVLIYF
jgi:hypothetical protein